MAGFSDLPVEMRTNIFAFVRSRRDRKASCMVSREWRDTMAPVMWNVLHANLEVTSSRTLDTLLHPNNGILPHVRYLYVWKEGEEVDEVTDSYIKLLISALPRNRLTGFNSSKISILTLQLLLQNHQELTTLEIELEDSDGFDNSSPLISLSRATWMLPSLFNITTLMTYVSMDSNNSSSAYDNFWYLTNNCPNLAQLEVRSASKHDDDDLDMVDVGVILPAPGSPLKLSHLTRLHLENMDILSRTTDLLSYIDMSKLFTLELVGCDNIAPLLRHLSTTFAQATPALECLEITLRWSSPQADQTVQAIEALLSSFNGLYELFLDVSQHTLVDKACIINHASNLYTLGLSTGESISTQHYSVPDLAAILNSCPKLSNIGLNLPGVNLGQLEHLGADFHLGSSSGAFVQSELAATLDVLSAHPKIHTLRMLNLPNIDYGRRTSVTPFNFKSINDDQARLCQIVMQNFATRVMQYVVYQGSNIQVFSPSAYSAHVGRPERDTNGHQWPHYTYTRGRLTDVRGLQDIVAAPLRDEADEIPESVILFWHY